MRKRLRNSKLFKILDNISRNQLAILVIFSSLASVLFCILQAGILFDKEWTYVFYGLLVVLLLAGFLGLRGLSFCEIISAVFSVYIVGTVSILLVTALISGPRSDIRLFLSSEAVSVLHKYRSTENYSRGGFFNHDDLVFYEFVKSEDVIALRAIDPTRLWNNKHFSYQSSTDWVSMENKNVDDVTRSKINISGSECIGGVVTLCINKSTGEVLVRRYSVD